MTTEQTGALAADTVPRRSLKARFRKSKGKTLVGVGKDNFEFSDTGADVLGWVDGARSVAGIAREMQAAYDLDEAEAFADVVEFLGELHRLRVIEF
jgi:hypothetical protein